jgi:hypothetical protein
MQVPSFFVRFRKQSSIRPRIRGLGSRRLTWRGLQLPELTTSEETKSSVSIYPSCRPPKAKKAGTVRSFSANDGSLI